MGTTDKRVDTYIAKSADFARPILKHLRNTVHKGCPEVQETMKWSFPHFDYQGIMCSMAAFKEHCSFGFWKASLMKRAPGLGRAAGQTAMGNFGRITSLADLPKASLLVALVKQAAALNETGAKIKRAVPKVRKELKVPAYFLSALRKNKRASDTYTGFSPSAKREYVLWVIEAKTEETRNTRLATSVEWMAKGRPRNWKYMQKK